MIKKSVFATIGLASTILASAVIITACQPTPADTNSSSAEQPTLLIDKQVDTAEDTDEHIEHVDHDMNDMSNMDDMNNMTTPADNEMQQAYQQGMEKMHDNMMAGMSINDADLAFAKGMLPHHQGAVAMAEVELKYGKDETMRKLAEDIIQAQQAEIEQMQRWIAEHPDTEKQENTEAMQQAYHESMQAMHTDMMSGIAESNPDMAFAKGMLPHHQGAVAMAEVELKYGKDDAMRKLAENIIQAQQSEIKLMQDWIAEHS